MTFENKEMRAVLYESLKELMNADQNVVVIDADLSKPNGTMPLRKDFPDRALDVGIAEQNMASVAAGLSSYGFIPLISSFTPFSTRRICDQVAISLCYSKQNVKILGTDPGISAELNGGTHMSFEDIGVLRSIPNIVIFEPCDAIELHQAIPKIFDYNGVVYIRTFRKVLPLVHSENYSFELFSADVLREGTDVTIFTGGIMAEPSLRASEILGQSGISAEVINIHTVKPIDAKAVISSARKTRAAVVAENHNLLGGLMSAVAEVLISECPIPVKGVGIKDKKGEVGKLPYLKDTFNMNVGDIVEAAKQALEMKK